MSSQHCFTGVDLSHLPLTKPSKHQCATCARASMRRHDAPAKRGVQYTRFGQCVCSDTCDMGVYSVPFGFRYFLTFLDMATRYLYVYFLRTHEHAEVKRAFLQFMADAKPKPHLPIRATLKSGTWTMELNSMLHPEWAKTNRDTSQMMPMHGWPSTTRGGVLLYPGIRNKIQPSQ